MKCPYKCNTKNFSFYDCIDEPGAQPKEGDVGMCSLCGGWWEMKNQEAVPYLPTEDMMKLVIPNVMASRSRAAADAKLHGKRLL